MELNEEFNAKSDAYDDDDFAEIDALIEYLNTLPQDGVFVLNYPRIQQMRFASAAIKKAMKGRNGAKAKIVCKQSELEPSMGYIDIESKDIDIFDTEWFARAAEFANNTEIYPLSDDRVRMTLTFHGILSRVS